MSDQPLQVLWIDDTSTRKGLADSLEQRLNANVQFVCLAGEDVADGLASMKKEPAPGLIIVDHILDKTRPEKSALHRGTTVAEALREKWPKRPVIGISAAENTKIIGGHEYRTYDDFYLDSAFGDKIDGLRVIAADFAKVGRARTSFLNKLPEWLDPPSVEIDRIKKIVPDELRKTKPDRSLPSLTYCWIRESLFKRAGFLYNTAWCAVAIGLREESFKRIQAKFAECRYRGIFALPHMQRWWSASIRAKAHELGEDAPPAHRPWQIGPLLPGMGSDDVSVCEKCNEQFPEVVGFSDESSTEEMPLHVRCSEPHPAYSEELFFEEVRIMSG